MPARLKVFAARIGFFDTVIAASSQKAALEAWGMNQDLFKEGLARAVDDPAALVALDQPGVVLKRTAGSSDAYTADAQVRENVIAPGPARKPEAAAKPKPAKPKPPADRTALDRAEAALAQAARDHEQAMEGLAERRRALEADEAAAEQVFRKQRTQLEASLSAARRAYEKAGGRD
jgi:hypothetical protein